MSSLHPSVQQSTAAVSLWGEGASSHWLMGRLLRVPGSVLAADVWKLESEQEGVWLCVAMEQRGADGPVFSVCSLSLHLHSLHRLKSSVDSGLPAQLSGEDEIDLKR